jgi:DNA-binding transcriptional regulator YhcF (GntR family)
MRYNFTDGVRQALAAAQDHANRLGHDFVCTEHILLGLIDVADPVVGALLSRHGVQPAELFDRVNSRIRPPTCPAGPARQKLPYTRKAKKTLELAMAAARKGGRAEITPDHLLQGLLAVEDCLAAAVLREEGVTADNLLSAAAGGQPSAERLALDIDDASDHSIYEQIVEQIQERIAVGALDAGERLPTVRRLADTLDIAPGTVARAYRELERLELVTTQGARGTRVAAHKRAAVPDAERAETLTGLLRPVAVAAFHLGASADDMRRALERAMGDIFEGA